MSTVRSDRHIARILAALAIVASLSLPSAASERPRDAAAKACIAENSGADSVDCLMAIADAADTERLALEEAFLARAQARLDANDIGETHHGIAVADMRSAAQAFKDYAEHQCEAEVGLSDAAASGSGQIHWSCKIRLIDDRIAHLRAMLARDALRPVATPASTATSSLSPTSPGSP
ncbi:MAG: DUF1311 domain-containing protein [Xanthomonadaceae bacterium]|nr:DUF1311 domain-containing protein [Xanthomonadaceae bacterium]